MRIACLVYSIAVAAPVKAGESGGRSEVLSFGAVPDGRTDCTAAFQRALDAAGEHGGTVRVPPGRYLLAGSIVVPTGVALEGSWRGPHHGAWREGSTLLVVGGRGEEGGPAAIELRASSALRGFTVVYPEQRLADVQPYPWTIHGRGMHCTVQDVTLVNSYNGIAMGPEPNELHLIRNVFGCVLRRGILIDGATDIGRIENVHFNPHYWVRAGYPGSPGVWRARRPDGGTEVRQPQEYMGRHLEAFIFGRTDWEYVLDTFVFGAKIGYRFIRTPRGAANGNFLGIGADWCTTCLRVDASQPMGILVANGEFVGQPACEATVVVASGVLAVSNSSFWGPHKRCVRVEGGRSAATFSQCIFQEWDRAGEGFAALEAAGGSLTVQGCLFRQDRPAIALAEDVRSACIFGNTFRGEAKIENRAKGDVKIDLNVSRARRAAGGGS